jgi:aminobenzoyl-glutamate transport protein
MISQFIAYFNYSQIPNVINPLLPHFALVVGFAQRWQKEAGVGTIVALMIPYAAAILIAWLILLLLWFILGIPVGPGYPVRL